MTSVAATRGRLTGDHHDDTTGLSLEDIAAMLTENLANVQDDDMLPADAEFTVDADNTGDEPVLRVTVTCGTDISDSITGIAMHLAEQVFQLASVYNEVDLDHPGHPRFLQDIHVQCGDVAAVRLVGAMVQSVSPRAQSGRAGR
ncbi:hypothetical protein [Lentzea aerocolonigenes]|uniref:hypothetical protein n=1 Tax=Lentzea aerocolonigenes TaxID=68170 RepID=UPI0004C3C326|nr:hypothetical protein [Lentzea aerocolonigenes]MCP2243301.1 hypothetical protein [Lentzea aerocolonigenes]